MPTCRHESQEDSHLGGGNRFGTRRRFDELERISFNGFDPNAPRALKQPPRSSDLLSMSCITCITLANSSLSDYKWLVDLRSIRSC